MSHREIMEDTLTLSLAETGYEEEMQVRVAYLFHKGYRSRPYGPSPEPGEPDSVEIESIEVRELHYDRATGKHTPVGEWTRLDGILDRLLSRGDGNEKISEACIAHHHGCAIAAQEDAAEARREARMVVGGMS